MGRIRRRPLRWLLGLAVSAAPLFGLAVSAAPPTSAHRRRPALVRGLQTALADASPALASSRKRSLVERESSVHPLLPAIRAAKFWRRVGPIVAHYKLTEAWFKVAHRGDAERRRVTWERLHKMHAPEGLDVILELRGLFVKIGQLMSSRADFIPRPYVDAFSSLQDTVPPNDQEIIDAILRESLDFDDVFDSFGEVLGSASIGQVHKAKLTPKFGGDTVAVKVMHPGAEIRFWNDFQIFRSLCRVALPGWDPILKELEQQMMTEFDYVIEARNLQAARANILKSPFANRVKIPEPKIELCSPSVLVMEYLDGKKLADDVEDKLASILDGDKAMARKVLMAKQRALFESKDVGREQKKSKTSFYKELSGLLGEGSDNLTLAGKTSKIFKLMAMTRDARGKLSLLLDATGHQIFVDGLYNGDVHPGNVLVLKCGRLGLIDYGQTRRLEKHDRLALARVVVELGKRNVDVGKVSAAMRNFGFQSRDSNDVNTAKFAALYFDSDAEGKKEGFPTPQRWLNHLNSVDPMIVVPDPAVFVARTSFFFRGLGALLQQQLHTSESWRSPAQRSLCAEGDYQGLYNLGLTPLPVDDADTSG